MARYIDADALLNSLYNDRPKDIMKYIAEYTTAELPIKDKCAFCPHCKNCDVNDDLTIQPTADVVERKKGEWIKHSDRDCWYCSECKSDNYFAFVWNNEIGKHEFQDNYCPNCGSDMRGDKDE